MALHSRTFQPPAFAGRERVVGYTHLSGQYFKVANDLREQAADGWRDRPGHYYVFPCIVMYIAAFEAFLQEHLAFSRFSAERSQRSGIQDELAKLDALKNQTVPFQDFKSWVREIYRLYDRAGLGLDVNSDEYQNLLALKELRNSVVHYNPMFIELASWPARLEQALHRTKIEVVNAGWVANFSNLTVADWAHDTIRGAVQKFCEVSGAQNPFMVILERDGMPPWE
jgi:hypothetical protein